MYFSVRNGAVETMEPNNRITACSAVSRALWSMTMWITSPASHALVGDPLPSPFLDHIPIPRARGARHAKRERVKHLQRADGFG